MKTAEKFWYEQPPMKNIPDALEEYAQQRACEIANELTNSCEAHIKSNGVRFYGIEYDKLREILKKYGWISSNPF